ncbi:TIP41-like family-domain-containing protein [Dipodascopsis uninucleata]
MEGVHAENIVLEAETLYPQESALYYGLPKDLGDPSIVRNDWIIYASKKPILNSDQIDRATDELNIPLPEMIFGNNYIYIKNTRANWSICFNAIDALDRVVKHGNPDGGLIKVSYSESWLRDKAKGEDCVHEVVKPFDWTYTTDFKGTLGQDSISFELTNDKIPLDKLRRPDPILFFDDVVLFEDELGDNGISMLSAKIRVMPERLLLLSRFFLRVDDVMFRIRDTRVFIEFSEGTVLREYVEKQDSYSNVKRHIPSTARDFGLFFRDPNWIAEHLPTINTYTEKVNLDY